MKKDGHKQTTIDGVARALAAGQGGRVASVQVGCSVGRSLVDWLTS